jgi:hypothetical protein
MAASKIALALWLGGIGLFWSVYPLLFSQARSVLVLGGLTVLLTLTGWLSGLQLLVTWSGGLGLCNLTLALVLTSHPPDLWVGLSAGLTMFALVDGSYRAMYLRRCWLAPGVITALLRPLLYLSGLTLAAVLGLGILVTFLSTPAIDIAAPEFLTILGACLLVGFLVAFLLYTTRSPDD